MCTQWVFRAGSHSLIGVHGHSLGVQGVFNTHSLAFTCTHKHSGSVQYSLTGIQTHSQVFRACSVLTQMRSFSWSHHGESCSIMTQWWSCPLIGCSHSLNGVHVHSMGVQGVFNTHSLAFMCTQWVFRGCSHSLIGVHEHSIAVQGVFNTHLLGFTRTHKCSGSVQYVFSLFMYLKAQ